MSPDATGPGPLVETREIDLRCGREGCACRVRTARVDYFAFLTFKRETGTDLLGGLDLRQIGTEETVALVYSVLVHEDDGLTMEHVARHLTPRNAVPVLAAILTLVASALPDVEDGGGGDAEDPRAAARKARPRRAKTKRSTSSKPSGRGRPRTSPSRPATSGD
jgi:hypothetical protein